MFQTVEMIGQVNNCITPMISSSTKIDLPFCMVMYVHGVDGLVSM